MFGWRIIYLNSKSFTNLLKNNVLLSNLLCIYASKTYNQNHNLKQRQAAPPPLPYAPLKL